MAYDKFSTEKVFSDELVNILSNKLINRVTTEFSVDKLVPYGDLAIIINGSAVSPLPVVAFATPDAAVYNWLVKNLQDIINVQTQLSFKNRIQIVTLQAYFEIWFDETATATAITGPYNIPLEDTPDFTDSFENELYYQNWKTPIDPPITIYYMVGDPAPASIEIPVQIENHFATEEAGKYNSFIATANVVNYLGEYDNLNLAGGDITTESGLVLTENNLEQNVSLGYKNLSLLDPGYHAGIIQFAVEGVRADSGLTVNNLSYLRLFVELRVIGPDELKVTTSSLKLSHVKSNAPLPAQQFNILTRANFKIRISEYFELSSTGNLVYESTTWDGKKVYTGQGSQTIDISLTSEFDFHESPILSEGIEIENLDFYHPDYELFPTIIPVTAYLFDTHGFNVSPDALEFFAIKGVQNARTIKTSIVSTQSYVISVPYWIELAESAGEYYQELGVKPISANNLVAGIYQDVIVFTSNNAVFELPVMLRVVESIDVGFNSDRLNFTNDEQEFTNIYSNKETDRASISMEITRYDYSNFSKLFSNTAKGAFFENKMSIHLGSIISRAFYTPKKLFEVLPEALENYEIFPYYRPASVAINLRKEVRKTASKIEDKSFPTINFIKGRTPKKYQGNFGILNYETRPVRVTKNSKAIFNFVKQFGSHQLLIMRNNTTYKTINHTPGNNSLFGLAISFSDFVPGDVIEIRMPINENDYYSQRYLMFPENMYSYNLYFLTEYHTVECLEFTGALRLGSKYEAISNTSFKNLVEVLQNVEVKKELRLNLNTGHILKESAGTLEELIRSKRVWLEKEGREISLAPVVKEFLNEDSEQGTYSYDVEFIINRENDLQIYNGTI